MAHLAMFVSQLPGLRVTELSRGQAPDLVELVAGMETTYFGASQANVPEMLGTLAAAELRGTRGTAGVWDGRKLVAALLAYDALELEQGLFLDLFVGAVGQRSAIAQRLLAAARAYGATLRPGTGDVLKVETFGGDSDLARAVAGDGFTTHRVYLRMRLDFDAARPATRLPPGLTARVMRPADWPDIHAVTTAAFADHYDFHPVPLPMAQQRHDHETTDYTRWQLVFEGTRLVGVGISSNRYAAHYLGYVDTLAVLREFRGRGIGTYLLGRAFAADRDRGFSGTALHCDATSLTGATRLYESVGMRRDQHYDAWRCPLTTHYSSGG